MGNNQQVFTTLWETINGCLQHCGKQSTNIYNIVRNNQRMFTTLRETINGCLQHREKQSQYQHKLWHKHKLILINSQLRYTYYTQKENCRGIDSSPTYWSSLLSVLLRFAQVNKSSIFVCTGNLGQGYIMGLLSIKYWEYTCYSKKLDTCT